LIPYGRARPEFFISSNLQGSSERGNNALNITLSDAAAHLTKKVITII